LDLEEATWCDVNLDLLLAECLEDFPDDDNSDVAKYAAKIARSCITDRTREGHMRIVKAYISFHMKRDKGWDAKAVTAQTPYDVRAFIAQKCGAKMEGYEGKRFSTAVSTRAALSFWYRNVRPNESVTEWRLDEKTGQCHGLPTRSCLVSEFMIGLEKTKARSGETSQSARALMLKDIYRLHNYCLNPKQNQAELRWGVIRYTIYLFAWLMMLRIEEVISIEFESIDFVPGERECFDVHFRTRKSAQTGVLHTWRLFANDKDPKICPVRALIRLAQLYGKSTPTTGPLFLRIDKQGAIMSKAPVVSVPLFFWFQRSLTVHLVKQHHQPRALK
ncbi:hypothetical protein BJ138DRAFT_1018593, partial [Hygrophoropsis aurantiaca]